MDGPTRLCEGRKLAFAETPSPPNPGKLALHNQVNDLPRMDCILCGSETKDLKACRDGQIYIICGICDLRFLHPDKRLAAGEERSRYTMHQTAAQDLGYQAFVAPLLARLREVAPVPAEGLDYGAGHQPVLAGYLRELGYQVHLFDPFFWPQRGVLRDEAFDFILACEVAEHFFSPRQEFERLRRWLKPTATLLLNTEIFHSGVDFENWYYRRDPTHVVFYSAQTIHWIAAELGFTDVWVQGRVASLRRGELSLGSAP